MKQAKTALRYAKAMLDLAKGKNVEAEVNNDMKLIAQTIAESNDLQIALKSSVIKGADKNKVLNALFGDKVNGITKGLFSILEENRRLEILGNIAKKYAEIYDKDKGVQIAQVTTAVALTKEVEQKVQEKIIALTGNKATIVNNIDPEVLGGFVLRIGDMQYDASIANQFKELRKEFDVSKYISVN